MADVVISPNLNMPIPVVGVDPGPDYANNINASLTTIDNHNHTLGRGLQIPTAGINIDGDLPLNGYSLNSILSLQLDPQGAPLEGVSPFLNAVYVAGVDLYYNDGDGNQVRITSGGNVAGASGTITGLPSGTASASYQAASGTFQFQQATSTAANLDVASIALRYPGSYPTPAGNYIQLQVPSSIASGFSLTLPLLPVAQSFMTLDTAGNIIGYASVVKGIVGGNLADGTITSTQISATAGIAGSQLAASANILGSQLAAAAGILGSQLAINPHFNGGQARVDNLDIVVSENPAANGLKVIRGYVNGSASAGPIIGEGWVCNRNGTGDYTILFTNPFLHPAVTVASVVFAGAIPNSVLTVDPPSSASGQRIFISQGGSLHDFNFTFLTMGER